MDNMDKLIIELKMVKINPGRYKISGIKNHIIDASNAVALFDELGPFGDIMFEGSLIGIIDFTTFDGFSIIRDEDDVIVNLRAELMSNERLPIYMLNKYFRGDLDE